MNANIYRLFPVVSTVGELKSCCFCYEKEKKLESDIILSEYILGDNVSLYVTNVTYNTSLSIGLEAVSIPVILCTAINEDYCCYYYYWIVWTSWIKLWFSECLTYRLTT